MLLGDSLELRGSEGPADTPPGLDAGRRQVEPGLRMFDQAGLMAAGRRLERQEEQGSDIPRESATGAPVGETFREACRREEESDLRRMPGQSIPVSSGRRRSWIT